MTPEKREQEKTDHEMLIEIHQLMLGKGGCWDRGEKTAKDFYAFRLFMIIALTSILGSTGFNLFSLIKLLGN